MDRGLKLCEDGNEEREGTVDEVRVGGIGFDVQRQALLVSNAMTILMCARTGDIDECDKGLV